MNTHTALVGYSRRGFNAPENSLTNGGLMTDKRKTQPTNPNDNRPFGEEEDGKYSR